MILEIDETTLGRKGKMFGQPITNTRVHVRCDIESCQEHWWTIWRYRKERDTDICQSHKNALGICGMLGKKHKPETIAIFKDGRRAGDNNVSKRPEVREKISWSLRGRDPYWLKNKKDKDQPDDEQKNQNDDD